MPAVLVTGGTLSHVQLSPPDYANGPSASGLLGREVHRVFQLEGWESVGTALSRTNPPTIVKADITNKGEIEKVLNEVRYVQAQTIK